MIHILKAYDILSRLLAAIDTLYKNTMARVFPVNQNQIMLDNVR